MTDSWTEERAEWIRRGILELEFWANKAIHDAANEGGHAIAVVGTDDAQSAIEIRCASCNELGGHSSSCDQGPSELRALRVIRLE